MRSNQGRILGVLPPDWTMVDADLHVRLGFQLKLMGIHWRSTDEFAGCLAFFERLGLMEREMRDGGRRAAIRRKFQGAPMPAREVRP